MATANAAPGSSVLKQLLCTAGVRAAGMVGRAVVFLCAVRALHPLDYGYYSLIGTTLSLSSLIGTGNAASYFIRILPGTSATVQYGTLKRLAAPIFLVNCGLALAGVAGYALLFPKAHSLALWVALIHLLEIASALLESFFLGCNRIYASNGFMFARTAGYAALVAALMALGWANLHTILIAWAAGDVLALIAAGCMIDRRTFLDSPRYDIPLSAAARYSLPLLIAALAAMLIKFGDRYLIAYFLGVAAVSPYDIAYKIVNMVYSLTVLVANTVLVPRIMHAENRGDGGDRDLQIARGTKLALYGFGACLLIMAASSSAVWTRVTGNAQYASARGLALALGVSTLISIASNPAGWALMAKNRTGALAVIDTCGAFVIGAMDCLTLPVLGVYGAAISAIVGRAGTCTAKHLYARSKQLATLRSFTDWAEERRIALRFARAVQPSAWTRS
jgi:O-antigen/teichoic acid export membrane protein